MRFLSCIEIRLDPQHFSGENLTLHRHSLLGSNVRSARHAPLSCGVMAIILLLPWSTANAQSGTACTPNGASRPIDRDHGRFQVCAAGVWQDRTCSLGIVSNPLFLACVTESPTRTFRGKVSYDQRDPNIAPVVATDANGGRMPSGSDFRGWEPYPSPRLASGVSVVSMHGDVVLDAVTTDDRGSFSIRVPRVPSADDRVIVLAAAGGADGRSETMVADPGLTSIQHDDAVVRPGVRWHAWSWAWPTVPLPPAATLFIPEAAGSAALVAFHLARLARAQVSAVASSHVLPLVIWLGINATWNCGTCMRPTGIDIGGHQFGAQIWLNGDTRSQAYWSTPVIAHELGHWAMASLSAIPPGAGGPHGIFESVRPDLAWSEGWATWFSLDLLNVTKYYDVGGAGGKLWWFDLQDGGAGLWEMPSPRGRQDQNLCETEVAYSLHRLSRATNSSMLMQGLSAPRMQTARHSESGLFCLADFLDALTCSSPTGMSVPPPIIDGGLRHGDGEIKYPYRSSAPVCQ